MRTEKEPKTPIVDGDARPDMPVDTEKIKKELSEKKQTTGKKFEPERTGDINSLEDYKDAK